MVPIISRVGRLPASGGLFTIECWQASLLYALLVSSRDWTVRMDWNCTLIIITSHYHSSVSIYVCLFTSHEYYFWSTSLEEAWDHWVLDSVTQLVVGYSLVPGAVSCVPLGKFQLTGRTVHRISACGVCEAFLATSPLPFGCYKGRLTPSWYGVPWDFLWLLPYVLAWGPSTCAVVWY